MSAKEAVTILVNEVIDFEFAFVSKAQSKNKSCYLNIYPVIMVDEGGVKKRKVINDREFAYQVGTVNDTLIMNNYHTLKANQRDYNTRSLSLNISKSEPVRKFFHLLDDKIKSWFRNNFEKIISQSNSIPELITYESERKMHFLEKYGVRLGKPSTYKNDKEEIEKKMSELSKDDPSYKSLEEKMQQLEENYRKRLEIENEYLNDRIDYTIENHFSSIYKQPKSYIDSSGNEAMSGEKVYISYLCDPVTEGKNRIEKFKTSEKAKKMSEEEKNEVLKYITEKNKLTMIHNIYSHDTKTNEIKEIKDYGENGLGNFFNGYVVFQIDPFKLAGDTKKYFGCKITALFIYKVLKDTPLYYFNPLQPKYIESSSSENDNNNNATNSVDKNDSNEENDNPSKKRSYDNMEQDRGENGSNIDDCNKKFKTSEFEDNIDDHNNEKSNSSVEFDESDHGVQNTDIFELNQNDEEVAY